MIFCAACARQILVYAGQSYVAYGDWLVDDVIRYFCSDDCFDKWDAR